jgi:hypothetical protein
MHMRTRPTKAIVAFCFLIASLSAGLIATNASAHTGTHYYSNYWSAVESRNQHMAAGYSCTGIYPASGSATRVWFSCS